MDKTASAGAAAFGFHVLHLDAAVEAGRIEAMIRETLKRFKRRGVVVAVSGGIDSSVVLALSVRAVGSQRVCALMLPEQDSAPDTWRLSRKAAAAFGVTPIEEDITEVLRALGCYRRRDEAVQAAVPEFRPGDKLKIVLPSVVDTEQLRVFSVITEDSRGVRREARLSAQAYLGIVAASNFKQRVRKTLEYYYADKLNYAVAGTPNKLEYDQGFFVKNGDGSADLKPIAHLFKTQVYQLADYIGVPAEIVQRPPTTDTYSMPQSQQEFYFSLPYHAMDLCLYARDHGIDSSAVATAVKLTNTQVERVFRDIDQKRRTTAYLHTAPVTLIPR